MKSNRLISLLLAVLLPAVTFAQQERDNDFGIWSSADFSYRFKHHVGDTVSQRQPSRWSVGLRLEYRTCDLSRKTNLWFVRPSVGFRAAKWLQIALSYDYFCKATVGQHRALLDFTESIAREGLTVSLRERFIVAYAPDSDKWSWLVRPRLTARYHIGGTRLSPYMAFELYANRRWTMMHNFAGMGINLGKGSSIDLFYMFGLNRGTTRQDHIAGIGYGLKL